MKTSFAIACLLNSAVAVRFFDKQELSDAEVNEQVKRTAQRSGLFTHKKKLAGFSSALDAAQQGRELNEEDVKDGFGLNQRQVVL
jgi:hypothetical protein